MTSSPAQHPPRHHSQHSSDHKTRDRTRGTIAAATQYGADALLIERLVGAAAEFAADLADDDHRLAAVADAIRQAGPSLPTKTAVRLLKQAGIHACATSTPPTSQVGSRAGALMNVAQAIAPADPALSASLLTRCEELLTTGAKHKPDRRAQSTLSWMYASQGQWQRADRVAAGIKNAFWHAETMLTLAGIAAETAPERAPRYAASADGSAHEVADRSKRQDLLDRLGQAAVAIDPAMARRLANTAQSIAYDLSDGDWSPTLNIAFALADGGHISEAREELGHITDDASPQSSVSMRAQLLLNNGRLEEAERLTQALGGISPETLPWHTSAPANGPTQSASPAAPSHAAPSVSQSQR